LNEYRKKIKFVVDGWPEEGCEDRDILSRINKISLGGGKCASDIRIMLDTGVYISKFKVDLVGNKRFIELRYEMDIVTFNLLVKLQIYSS